MLHDDRHGALVRGADGVLYDVSARASDPIPAKPDRAGTSLSRSRPMNTSLPLGATSSAMRNAQGWWSVRRTGAGAASGFE